MLASVLNVGLKVDCSHPKNELPQKVSLRELRLKMRSCLEILCWYGDGKGKV